MEIKSKIVHYLLEDKLEQIDKLTERVEKLEAEIERKNQQLQQSNFRIDNLENIINQYVRPEFEHCTAAFSKVSEDMTSISESVGQVRESGEILRRDLENISLNLRNNNAAIEGLQSDTEFVKYKLGTVEKSVRFAPSASSAATVAQPSAPAEVSGGSDYEEIDYFDFENHFRGSIDSIKKAQEAYIPYFKDKKNVIDIGCGRGEFLSLMQDNGINAVGVDIYEPYADYCRMKGLNAECGDGSEYLSKLESVDGIFVGQVVEHLKPHQIIRLCNTAFEKLSDGGCIIIETPNPTSLSIYTNAFYIDPSHIKPVHPLTMKYYLEKAGFRNIEIIFTESSKPKVSIPPLKSDAENIDEFNEAVKKVSDIIFGSQDYAVVAVK